MTDPWHAESLDQLVIFLRSRAPVRWAVVSTTSVQLEQEVVGALRERLQDFLWQEVAPAGIADLESFITWRLTPPDPRRVALIGGFRELVAANAGADIDMLGAFNFQREALAARGEGLVFLTDEASATELMRQAPDFFRFTIGFNFERVEDWIEQARAQEARTIPEPFAEIPDEVYERQLEQARAANRSYAIAQALLSLAERRYQQDRLGEAHTYAEEAITISQNLKDPAIETRVFELFARVLSREGNAAKAIAFMEKASAKAKEEGVSADLAYRAGETLANVMMQLGRYHDALEIIDRMIAAGSGMEPSWKIRLLPPRATTLTRLGRLAEATGALRREVPDPIPTHIRGRYFETWVNLYERVGDLYNAARAVGQAHAHYQKHPLWFADKASQVLWKHGQVKRAAELLSSCSLDTTGSLSWRVGLSWSQLTVALYLENDDERLSRISEACLETCRAYGHPAWVSVAILSGAEVNALAGRLPEALTRGDEAHSMLEEISYGLYLPDCEHTLARFHRLAGHLDKATNLAETAAQRAHDQGNRPAAARADTERALVALTRRDAATARVHTEAALQCIGETRYRIDEPAALAALAAAQRLAGDTDDANERRWRRLVRGMGARGLERRIEQSLAAAGLLLPAAEDT